MKTSFRLSIILCVVASASGADEFPGKEWSKATASEVGLATAPLQQAKEYALTGGGAGMIIRKGKLVLAWGDQAKLYDLKSTSKSIGVTALAIAIADKKIGLDDKARDHHPTLGDKT